MHMYICIYVQMYTYIYKYVYTNTYWIYICICMAALAHSSSTDIAFTNTTNHHTYTVLYSETALKIHSHSFREWHNLHETKNPLYHDYHIIGYIQGYHFRGIGTYFSQIIQPARIKVFPLYLRILWCSIYSVTLFSRNSNIAFMNDTTFTDKGFVTVFTITMTEHLFSDITFSLK